MKKFLIPFCLIVFFTFSAFSQSSPAPSPTPIEDDREVVKITTNLIQVDVTVTDSKGRIITDLKPGEIEIYENDEKQNITNFSFINGETGTVEKAATKITDTDRLLTPPPGTLKPELVRRTIALVVDDLSLSFQSVYYVRQSLRKFVDEQMQPNDLVAIIRTGSGIGALQQFTSDKRQLYAAIEKIKWNPIGNGGVGAFAPLSPDELPTSDPSAEDDDQSADALADAQQFREDIFATGTLGAVNYIVRGLRTLPGRKSVILFSDGIRIRSRDGFGNRVFDSLRRLADLANRASVVVYTLDARGLQYTGLTAADNTSGMTPQQIDQRMSSRSEAMISGQEGLRYLSDSTGGIAIINNNDLSYGVQKVLNDQNGYYLIAYQPDDETFDPVKRKFNRLKIKVTRPGLKVRYRSGFFGVTDENVKPVPKTAEQQIAEALSSPFATGQIAVKLTPLFFRDDKKTSFVSSFIHVKAADLKFTDEPEGWKKTVFDIVVIAFGDNGVPVDQLYRTETLKIRGPAYDMVQKDGFVYTVQFPIKKPGGYQMRIAVRDSGTSQIGSANQFVEVPNTRKNRMLLSGVVLQHAPMKKTATSPEQEEITVAEARQDTALRQFRAGTVLSYNLSAYNPQLVGGSPKLKTQIKIFKNGALFYVGKEIDARNNSAPGADEVLLGGIFELGGKMEPGEYMLQIIVTDTLAKQKNQIKSQWLDFEIIK